MVDGGGSKGRKARLIMELARGETVANAAKASGVGRRTAHRLLLDPVFRTRLNELRRRMVDRAIGQLSGAATEAVETMRSLLSTNNPANIRLGAAKAIVGELIHLQEHAELTQRVADLEARLDEQSQGKTR